jgi:uncharacterized surface protein with fasciclin (FAS1) repeats
MRKATILIIAAIALLILSMAPIEAQSSTIAQIIQSNEDLTLLAQALQTADPSVLETLNGSGPLTLFAPNDTAFHNLASFLEMDLDDLMSRDDILTMLLQYHTVQGTYFSNQLTQGTEVGVVHQYPTLLPNTAVGVIVSEDGSLTLNQVVEVEQADIAASNGVLHIINDVLLTRVITDEIDRQEQLALENTISVRIGQFAPEVEAVDVYLDGEAVLTNVEFGTVSDWIETPAHEYQVTITPAGESVDEALIGPAAFDLIEGSFTIALVGSPSERTLQAHVIPEDFSEMLQADDTRLTVFHAIEGAPAVDILASGETPILFGLAYPGFLTPDEQAEASEEEIDANDGYEIFDVDSGSYALTIVSNEDPATVLIDMGDVELAAGSYYFVAAYGTRDDPQVVVVETDAQAAADLRGVK